MVPIEISFAKYLSSSLTKLYHSQNTWTSYLLFYNRIIFLWFSVKCSSLSSETWSGSLFLPIVFIGSLCFNQSRLFLTCILKLFQALPTTQFQSHFHIFRSVNNPAETWAKIINKPFTQMTQTYVKMLNLTCDKVNEKCNYTEMPYFI